MRPSPSKARIFGDNAKEAKRLLTCETQEIKTPEADNLRRQSCNPPKKYMVRLTALNALSEFYGVESAKTVDDEYAEYLNSGDTYAETLIYWRGRYRVQCLGDFIETMERNGVKFL